MSTEETRTPLRHSPRLATPYLEICLDGRHVFIGHLRPGCNMLDITDALHHVGALDTPGWSFRRELWNEIRYIFRNRRTTGPRL